jgi:hypothetical protein
MIEESKIILEKSREYVGRHRLESEALGIIKDQLIFTQENYDRVMDLGDLEELVIGLEVVSAEHFRNRSMKRAKVIIDPNDSKYPPKLPWREY